MSTAPDLTATTIGFDQNYDSDPMSPELRAGYAANQLSPLWESRNAALPPPTEEAHVWHWLSVRPLMMETAKITLPSIIERRVMQLVNPTNAHSGLDATSGLINGTIQALMPGEHARPHRHSMHALRFVLEGRGAETIVEGKPCLMEPGDLVSTPGWTWHEHRNVGGAPTVWVDILDAALQRILGVAQFQPGPIQHARSAVLDSAFMSAAFVPVMQPETTRGYSPVFRYAWADAKRAVAAAPPANDGSRTVRYTNPLDGGPVLPTLDCYLHQIDEGTATSGHRTTANALCVVVEGEGETRVGDQVFSWGPRDVFTLPQQRWISHRCTSGPARIFTASNREIYRHLGLLVEETGEEA